MVGTRIAWGVFVGEGKDEDVDGVVRVIWIHDELGGRCINT